MSSGKYFLMANYQIKYGTESFAIDFYLKPKNGISYVKAGNICLSNGFLIISI